jgi:tRNA-dihydrouridine synthase
MRRGIDDTAASRDNFFEILDGAFHHGVAAITVHGRTVVQKYIGPSRWEFLSEVKRHVGDKTILGSGDLFTAQDCLNMLQQTGINGVTVARGAIGNPWIFNQVRELAETGILPPPPTLFQQRETIEEHYRLAESLYGTVRAGILMRKFGIKYAASHPEFEMVRGDFARAKSLEDWNHVLTKWYGQDGPGAYVDGRAHKASGSLECG